MILPLEPNELSSLRMDSLLKIMSQIFIFVFFIASPLLGSGSEIKITGFVKSRSVFQIGPPQSKFGRYKINSLSPEGANVEKDEIVIEFEAEGGSNWESNYKKNLIDAQVSFQTSSQKVSNEIQELESKISDKEKQLSLLEIGQVSKISDKVDTTWLLSNRDKIIQDLDIEARKIDLTLQKAKLERKKILLVAMQESFAKTKERYETELSSIEEAKKPTVKSPAAGVVSYLRIWRREKPRVGMTLYRGNKPIAIFDDKNLFIEAYLKEENFNAIKKDMPVQIRVLGSREVTVNGTIKNISSIAMLVSDFESNLPENHPLSEVRAFKLEISLDNVPSEAKPEGEVEVRIQQ